ncbi:MAG: hypothetical protein ACAF41_29840 [Leptolyngbya sp. BL-A-14]
MNLIWTRLLRSAYRREPITSFALTVGVVESAIGGLNEHWALLAFGLSTVGVAIALRLWQQRKQMSTFVERAPTYILPAQIERPSLPPLKPKRKPSDGKR